MLIEICRCLEEKENLMVERLEGKEVPHEMVELK
jgi:hypothetical protein